MTDRDSLAFRDEVIDGLRRDLTEGEHGLRGVPSAVKLVIRDGMWSERVIRKTGEMVRFDRFVDFVGALPPKGLGASVDLIMRICADDPEAVDMIDQATKEESGGDRRSVSARAINVDNINVDKAGRPDGTSVQQAIRRLRKGRPDLHAQVIAGDLSPHAAMIKAGFRPKTATVRLDDPDKVSAFLAKHFEAGDIRTIADLAIHIREGAR